ncbi:MAG: hypothetical protein QNK37_27820 [Acidobacteriota bacterium]|nr:hypothetical protein [Acidobacteriota bacterium]
MDYHYETRSACPDDAEEIALIFQRAYGSGTHACRDPAVIRDSFRRDWKWLVVYDDATIVACAAGAWHPWNRMYETLWWLTNPAYTGRGVMTRLAPRSMRDLFAEERCEVIFGFLRSSIIPIYRRATEDALVILGHEGGSNIRGTGEREYLLVGMTPHPERRPRRIPPACPIFSLPVRAFIENRILAQLPFETVDGVYPEAAVVGPPSTDRVAAGDWRMELAYKPAEHTIHVTGFAGPPADAETTLAGLESCLEKAPAADLVFLYVLADKVRFIRGLRRHGFVPTAYLPAWYYTDNGRCDCVLVARYTGRATRTIARFGEMIDQFDIALDEESA